MTTLSVTPTDSPDNTTTELSYDFTQELNLLRDYFADLVQQVSRTDWDFCACCWSRVCTYDEQRGPMSVFCGGCALAIDAVEHTCAGNRELAIFSVELMATLQANDKLGSRISTLDHVHGLVMGTLPQYLKSNDSVSGEGLFTAVALDLIEKMPEKNQSDVEESAAVALDHILAMGDILEQRVSIAGQYDRLRKQTLKHTAILLSSEIGLNIAYVWSLFPDTHPREFINASDRVIRAICSGAHPVFDMQDVWRSLCLPSTHRYLDFLRWMPYERYLKTPHWQETRTQALEHAGHRCQVCNSTSSLHTHHRSYDRRGAELPEDLIVLCRKCHDTFHKNGRLAR